MKLSYRHIVLGIIASLINLTNGYPQEYGYEWIDYNQQEYYKIALAEDGIYRLTYQDLENAGFPVTSSNLDPRRFQLFHRGNEIAIIVTGQNDGRFDEADYIEFYGERNDGTLDKELYVPQEAHPHPYYNLYSDTAAYFLTWRLDNTNGKRISSFKENNVTGLPAAVFYTNEKTIINHANYSTGRRYPLGEAHAGTYYSHFDYGEGWTGPFIRKDNYIDYVFDSIFDLFQGSDKPVLELLLAGRNNLSHNVEIFVGPTTSGLRSLTSTTWDHFDNQFVNETLEWNDIGSDGKLTVRVQVNGFEEVSADFASVSYIRLQFTNLFIGTDQDIQRLTLQENPNNKTYIEFSQVVDPYVLWDITDTDNILNIEYNVVDTSINAIVPNTITPRTLLLAKPEYRTPKIEKSVLRKLEPGSYDFLIISHPEFHKPTGAYNDPATAYVTYRSSAEGGSYHPLLVEIQELYNQYSYGEITPLAIYRFCRHMADQGNPEYLLLIGKSLDITSNYYRKDNTGATSHDFVPTGGYPGSDNVFTTRFSETTYEPGIPTGRITAKSSGELAAYLDKLIEAESFGFKEQWKKELIHLSGGATEQELIAFAFIVDEFKQVAEGLYLGAQVETMHKKTSNPIEEINISEEVNEGLSQITFFGHSSANVTDIDIGYVSNPGFGYNNKGKYPFMLVNGCNAGNIFTANITFGEDWLITADKGAIAVAAHSNNGFTKHLREYSNSFYATAYGDSAFIHQPLGKVLQETARRYLESITISEKSICQVQQLVYQGDPAYRLFNANKPDYAVTDDELWLESFNNQSITALTDSFNIAIVTRNFGRADTDSINVSVKRTFQDGTELLYNPIFYPPVFYTDTLLFTIYSIPNTGAGINRFDVVIDPLDSIPELDKSNNTATLVYNIPLRGTQNLYPYDLSIVNKQPVELIAQANDLLSEERNMRFEIDTTQGFISPFLQSNIVSGKGIAQWTPELLDDIVTNDSTVYYWRTKFEEVLPEEDTSWTISSFLYIKDSPSGWAQFKHPQQQYNNVEGLYYDGTDNSWKFIESKTNISLTTFGASHPEKDYTDVSLHVNDISYIFNTRYCTANSINALAFDEVSTNPYLVLNFSKWDILDRRSCGRRPQFINNFLDSEITGTQDYLTAYIDAVKEGDFVLLFSIGELTYDTWPQHVLDKLTEIGVSSETMSALSNGEPIILLGKKGAVAGTAIEITANPGSGIPGDQQEISLEEEISGKYTSGSIQSTLIGPGRQWGNFYYHSANPSVAEYSFRVIGLNKNGTEEILIDNIQQSPVNLSGISPEDYPYLRVYFDTENTSDYIPAQLINWLVTYWDVPEGVLMLQDGQTTGDIEVQEGEDVITHFSFKNISEYDFEDSLKVSYSVWNNTTNREEVAEIIIPPVKAKQIGDSVIINSTIGKVGVNDLKIIVNPRLVPEKIYNNNILDLTPHFTVNRDETHPILDVSFDGRYILDGEIVSPSPLIKIVLKDENELLLKEDTTGVDILLKNPCDECSFERISFSSPAVTWTPATEEENFSVDYQPQNLEDGIYTLQVQASDASGNKSGTQPYEVRFEVINESQISHFFPYPNPFSTSTRFIFTLTGSVIPDEIKIQIMTVSGRVVREIIQDEIGTIRIGNNITDYAWDGKDEFGDQLANGVYLYQVIIRSNGQTLDHRDTSADRGFKKNFGKLYILR